MTVTLRDARRRDPGVPELLYLSASAHYDRYAGSRDRAVAMLRRSYPRGGHVASHAVCRVAELDGRPAGVVATFAVADLDRLGRRFTLLTAPWIPPWHWPAAARTVRTAGGLTPPPPERALYLDALAVASWARRRGVARALLDDAGEQARSAGLPAVALDTGLENEGGRALYEASGFAVIGTRRGGETARRAIGVSGLVAYARTV